MRTSARPRAPWCAAMAIAVCLLAGTSLAATTIEVRIVKPAANDVVTIGSSFEIKFWVSEQVLVLPEASVDSGLNWFGLFPPDFMGCITASDTTTWTWTVDQEDATSGPALLRIVGYMDPGIEETSSYFVLAPAGSSVRSVRDVRRSKEIPGSPAGKTSRRSAPTLFSVDGRAWGIAQHPGIAGLTPVQGRYLARAAGPGSERRQESWSVVW